MMKVNTNYSMYLAQGILLAIYWGLAVLFSIFKAFFWWAIVGENPCVAGCTPVADINTMVVIYFI